MIKTIIGTILVIILLSGCSIKNLSVIEVSELHEKDFDAIEIGLRDQNIVIYIDVNKNDPRYQAFIKDMHDMIAIAGKKLGVKIINENIRIKCSSELLSMFSIFYNADSEYRQKPKIQQYATCINARVKNNAITTYEMNKHVTVSTHVGRLANSDYGQNYRLGTWGVIEPDKENPVIFVGTKTRRNHDYSKNDKYIKKMMKIWVYSLARHKVPYHINKDL